MKKLAHNLWEPARDGGVSDTTNAGLHTAIASRLTPTGDALWVGSLADDWFEGQLA